MLIKRTTEMGVHDRLFKELLSTFLYEFLELFLPDLAVSVERTSIEFMDKETFTELAEGERREADLVVKARLKEQDTRLRAKNLSSSRFGCSPIFLF